MTTTSKKKRGEKSISYMALEYLYHEGSMTYNDLTTMIRRNVYCENTKPKSVHTKLLEMEKANLVTRDDAGIWSLREGVTPETLYTGELEMTTDKLLEEDRARQTATDAEPDEEPDEEGEAEGEETPAATAKPSRRPNVSPLVGKKPGARAEGVSLDQREMFIKHMSDIGVAPKEAIPTIADIFFSGDIEDLNWLTTVLKRHAQGYVTAYQRNLILGFWAKTRGLPYSEDEEDWQVPEKGAKGTAKAKAGTKDERPKSPLDAGQGWRVGKDKGGDWVPLMGGPLDYEEALDRAERRATIAAYTGGEGEDDGESAAVSEPATTKGKGKGGGQSFIETMMLKVVENMLDGGGKKDSAAEAKIEVLQEQVNQMREDRVLERFENLEGQIAALGSRDPWDDFTHFQQQAQRFGYAPNTVTDNSPAVQLIKDSTDKLDKNAARLMGIFERVALKSEEFSPESTRTPAQREDKAESLLHTAQTRDQSRQLRKDVFHV